MSGITQYFLNNETPITQSITLVAGSYCLWIEGTGSATFNGLTATDGNPKVFTLGSGFTGNCVISGTVTKVMLNSGLFPAPFTPTSGTTISVVSEAGNTSFDLDLPVLYRLKTGFMGPLAQGHFELEVESNVDSGWFTTYPSLIANVFTVNNSTTRGCNIFRYSATSVAVRCVGDGTSSPAELEMSVEVGKILNISIDYGTYTDGTKKMRLTVNGVKSSLVTFSMDKKSKIL